MKVNHRWVIAAAALLMGALAFAQTDQHSSAASPAQPSTAPTAQTNDKCPCKPRTIVDAATASKQKAEAEPPAKIYRNKDLKDPASPGTASPEAATSSAPESTSASSAQKESAPASTTLPSPAAFKAQGDTYKNQILLEKEKIADIQNRNTSLKYQFDEWSASFAQDPTDASNCWTSSYSMPYYKEWCDTGRKLKAQYDLTQDQLEQEQAKLEKMQEAIRRKGYGNAVYDPDFR